MDPDPTTANAPLVIEVSSTPEATVCRLSGSASMEACGLLNDQLLSAATNTDKLLAVDLSELRFICSLGLGSIVAAYLRMAKKGGAIRLVAPQPQVLDMLELTKLGTLLPVRSSLQDALEH